MSFRITIQATGHAFQCAPGETILEAGLAAGFFLPYSCRSGVCNTCRGKVLEGSVDLGSVHPAHLSLEDRALGFAMLCQARPLSDTLVQVSELDASEVIQAKDMPTRVLALERAAPDVMLVKLGTPANEPLVFVPGQYLEVQLPSGERRFYSMANGGGAQGVRQLELHIRHLPGGRFTEQVFSKSKVRDMWKVRAPLGTFYLREKSSKPIVMVASGTGFAPIKAIVEHSLAKGFTRPISLYWGGRQPPDLYMQSLAQRWADEHRHFKFIPVLSDAAPAEPCAGRTGFVHHAVLDDFSSLQDMEVYVCGAPVVVDAARRDFVALRGLPQDAFFADSFITAAEKAMVMTNSP